MTTEDVLFLSIAELGARFRAGSLSPVDVTRATLQRIEQLDTVLNAFITVTGDLAMEQAEAAERELRSGVDRGPLHGVPVALKDLADTAGVRTTCGARILSDHVPTVDATVVTRLREAGAVLVGKTNMLEFAYGIVHPDFGQTNNPWDPTRTAGGSSGGSAAAVAAGLCFAALGTDTGGSIRIPASYCGVSGLKPTYGLVPLDGIFALSWSLDHGGPIARSSEDAALLLEVLAQRTLDVTPRGLKGVRLGVLEEHIDGPEMEPGVREVFMRALEALKDAGAHLVPVRIDELDAADAALMDVLLPEASVIHERWVRERPDDYAKDTRMQIELGFDVRGVAHVKAQRYRQRLAANFLDAMHGLVALLSPTVAWVAPHEDPVVADEAGAAEARRTAPTNLTGFPALSVNAGFSQQLPVGLHITARPNDDAVALALGAAIERLLGANRVPPLLDMPSVLERTSG
ncbi:amidase [Deinococcus yavapaiensis]|uniref:Aspartyl-tRNA(Asn)/glutamyl-tRNA(Gln) amidotransferase subunit A n=1 Tax=Deinococcus yavapaiensis KR-236 TaxID=694435 RepID=A0A318SCG1_9DEIO|nr:amidase [Deinococcus yavapaiensis]PYE49370.1 aspartyl-tRNA(Asn)/glutamyl-tRNA(Gln) amidotransferase subunit A [Deinococcus yavapaiensis KR-236]